MKTYFSAFAVSALSCLASNGLASERAASTPSTALALRSADLMNRAARAVTTREGASRIAFLWVFPTADRNTVFVHFRTTTDHLLLLEMDGERIASLQDLTR